MPNRTTIIALSSARENSSDLGSGSAFCRRILRCDRRITGSTPACGTTPLNASHLVNAKKLFLPHEDTSIKLSFLKRIHRNCRHRLDIIIFQIYYTIYISRCSLSSFIYLSTKHRCMLNSYMNSIIYTNSGWRRDPTRILSLIVWRGLLTSQSLFMLNTFMLPCVCFLWRRISYFFVLRFPKVELHDFQPFVRIYVLLICKSDQNIFTS